MSFHYEKFDLNDDVLKGLGSSKPYSSCGKLSSDCDR